MSSLHRNEDPEELQRLTASSLHGALASATTICFAKVDSLRLLVKLHISLVWRAWYIVTCPQSITFCLPSPEVHHVSLQSTTAAGLCHVLCVPFSALDNTLKSALHLNAWNTNRKCLSLQQRPTPAFWRGNTLTYFFFFARQHGYFDEVLFCMWIRWKRQLRLGFLIGTEFILNNSNRLSQPELHVLFLQYNLTLTEKTKIQSNNGWNVRSCTQKLGKLFKYEV